MTITWRGRESNREGLDWEGKEPQGPGHSLAGDQVSSGSA